MGAFELATLILGLGFAGFSKGLAGLGLPLIATPILAGVFGPRAAVTIVTIPIFVSNTLLVVQEWRDRYPLRDLWPFLVASAIGAGIGTLLLARLDQRTFAVLIAAMVMVFVARGDRLLGEDLAARRAQVLGQAICFLGGVLQGTTSISSPLIGSYFHALRLRPAQFVWVLAAMFELNSAVQLIGYSLQGLYNTDIVALGVVGLIPTLGAMILGIWTRGRLDPVFFRRIIVVLVVASTLNLLWRTFV